MARFITFSIAVCESKTSIPCRRAEGAYRHHQDFRKATLALTVGQQGNRRLFVTTGTGRALPGQDAPKHNGFVASAEVWILYFVYCVPYAALC